MKKLELLRELGKTPTFNNKRVRELIGKDSAYTWLVVHRMKRDGLITEIEKDKYTVHEDPLVVASSLTWPSYISCWAALRHHGLTEQLPTAIHVVTTRSRKRREVEFGNARIVFIRTKPSCFFGFGKTRLGGLEVFVAEPEKALVDSALFRRVSFSEIADIVRENFKSIDASKLIGHLLKIGNSASAKRFGYLLECLGVETYGKLGKFVGRSYTKLDYARPAKGKKSERWMVMDNVGVRRAG
jgi:predicted transcriptional regulator of viral defense system